MRSSARRKPGTVWHLRNWCAVTTGMCCALALNLGARPEEARDVYQESFLRVYRNLAPVPI